MTIHQAIARLEAVKRNLKKTVGAEMVNFALTNIKKQNWHGKPYPPRKRPEKGRQRALLVKSGDGRRSIEYRASADGKVWLVAMEHMVAHNEGVNKTVQVDQHRRARYDSVRVGTGTFNVRTRRERTRRVRVARVNRGVVRSHLRRMNLPERRFFGKSNILTSNIAKTIRNQIIKALT